MISRDDLAGLRVLDREQVLRRERKVHAIHDLRHFVKHLARDVPFPTDVLRTLGPHPVALHELWERIVRNVVLTSAHRDFTFGERLIQILLAAALALRDRVNDTFDNEELEEGKERNKNDQEGNNNDERLDEDVDELSYEHVSVGS